MTNKKQSLAGIVRQKLEDIEKKLEHGFSYKTIIEELNNELKTNISLAHFKTLLHRARQRKRNKNERGFSPLDSEEKKISGGVGNNISTKTQPDNSVTSSNSRSLDSIIQGKPNLDRYAQIAKGKNK